MREEKTNTTFKGLKFYLLKKDSKKKTKPVQLKNADFYVTLCSTLTFESLQLSSESWHTAWQNSFKNQPEAAVKIKCLYFDLHLLSTALSNYFLISLGYQNTV